MQSVSQRLGGVPEPRVQLATILAAEWMKNEESRCASQKSTYLKAVSLVRPT
jgi:hypothetical protein